MKKLTNSTKYTNTSYIILKIIRINILLTIDINKNSQATVRFCHRKIILITGNIR